MQNFLGGQGVPFPCADQSPNQHFLICWGLFEWPELQEQNLMWEGNILIIQSPQTDPTGRNPVGQSTAVKL